VGVNRAGSILDQTNRFAADPDGGILYKLLYPDTPFTHQAKGMALRYINAVPYHLCYRA
jgi:hypothetical protein